MTGFLGVIRYSWLCKERKTLCAEVSANLSEIVKARHGGSCRTSQTWELEAGASRVQVICPYIEGSSLGCVRPWLGKANRNCKGGNRILCYKTDLQFTLKWSCGHLKLQSDYHTSARHSPHLIWSYRCHIASYHKMGEDNTVRYFFWKTSLWSYHSERTWSRLISAAKQGQAG